MIVNAVLKEELRQIIIKNAYFREKIILSSGKESDYYIDARLITLSPRGCFLCSRLMLDLIANDKIDAIGGPTLGADPFVGAFSVLSLQDKKPLNTFIIRKAAKAHGRQRQVEGPELKPGSRVVIVDDVATTGKAFLESIEVLRGLDVTIVRALCIVDRGEGAREALAAKGVEMTPLFNISEIHQP